MFKKNPPSKLPKVNEKIRAELGLAMGLAALKVWNEQAVAKYRFTREDFIIIMGEVAANALHAFAHSHEICKGCEGKLGVQFAVVFADVFTSHVKENQRDFCSENLNEKAKA